MNKYEIFSEKFQNLIESIQIELRYTAYIENRYFGEEEVTKYNETLFYSAREKII